MLEPETPSVAITDQADLDTFLAERGCSHNLKKGLHISPAPKGSGSSDTSIHHDEVLLDQPVKSNLESDS